MLDGSVLRTAHKEQRRHANRSFGHLEAVVVSQWTAVQLNLECERVGGQKSCVRFSIVSREHIHTHTNQYMYIHTRRPH